MPRPHPAALALPACLLSLASACIDREVTKVDPEQDSVEVRVAPAAPRRLDVLFVIDNSSSMTEENRSLVDEFPRMLTRLAGVEGGLPDLHLGVVTPDLGIAPYTFDTCDRDGGDGGRLHGATCPALGGQAFLSDERGADGERIRNYSGTIEDAFRCMADVGSSGCGFEQHLGAMEKAIDPAVNPGFLRDDAVLAVVIIADEDDCTAADPSMYSDPATMGDFRCHLEGVVCDGDPDPSAPGRKTGCRPREGSRMASLQRFVDALRRKKADPKDVVVVGIIGDPEQVEVGRDDRGRPAVVPSCPRGGLGASEPSIRLSQFLKGFDEDRRLFETLCTSDLSDALDRAGALVGGASGSTCLKGDLADRNPRLDGLQPECAVAQIVGDVRTSIPSCEQSRGQAPCWLIGTDDRCGNRLHQQVQLQRSERAPVGAYLDIQCVVE